MIKFATAPFSKNEVASFSKNEVAPFSKVGSPLDPNDIHGILMEKYLKNNIFSKPMIHAYDYWLDILLPKFLKEKFYFFDESYIYLDNIQYTSNLDNTPRYYREKNLSYLLKIEADLHFGKDNEEKILQKIHIADIPLMLGSKRCIIGRILSSPDPDYNLYQIQEDPLDPFGYFIINGTERTVIIQEKLRLNRLLNILQTSNDTKKSKDIVPEKIATITATNTYDTHYGTRMMRLMKNSDDSIDLFLSFFGKDKIKTNSLLYIPCLLLFKHPYFDLNIDQVMDAILQFAKPESKMLIQIFLSRSRFDFENNGDLYQYLHKRSSVVDFNRFVKDLDDNINKRFFPEIPNSAKMMQYAFSICRFCESVLGLRLPDDRDIWANKRLEWSPRSMENLFNSLWNNIYNAINKDIISGVNITLNSIQALITKESISTTFSKSFAGPKWGKAANAATDRMTEVLETRTILNVYSQLTKINVKTFEGNRTISIRTVQGDQWGFICPSETSDGEWCGIVKHLAVTAKISLQRDPAIILESVKDFLNMKKDSKYNSPFFVNGLLYGWCDGLFLRNHLINLKRKKIIWEDSSIVLEDYSLDNLNYDNKTLNVYCDAGRPIRPVLVYTYDPKFPENGTVVNFDPKMSFQEMLDNEVMEYIDPAETHYIKLGQDFDSVENAKRLYFRQKKVLENTISDAYSLKKAENGFVDSLKRLKFTNIDISPDSFLGYAANTVPMSNRISGPRVGYQAGMNKQAIEMEKGTGKDTKYTSAAGTSPNFITNINKILGIDLVSGGRNLSVAIMTFLGYNQEDAIIMNKDVVDNLYFSYFKNVTKEIKINSEESIVETLGFPRGSEGLKKNPYYRNISDKGFPKLGSVIKENDILVVKYDENGNINPIKASIDDEGRVVDVKVSEETGKKTINCRIKIKKFYNVQEGDKMAIRYSQKGVIGKILPAVDMPVMENGKAVDMIINPHGLPTRMTVSLLIELLTGDYSAMIGQRINATSFRKFDLEEFMQKLKEAGMNKFSYQKLLNPYTGRYFEDLVSVGMVYYQALPHVVASKIQMRATGPVDQRTRLVIGGRNRGGGIRAGGMEIDSFISHGALNFTLDRIMISSDRHEKAVCKKCGNDAYFNKESANYVCKLDCGAQHVGKIMIPYSFNRFMDIIRMGGIKGNIKYIDRKLVDSKAESKLEEIYDSDAESIDDEDGEDGEEEEKEEEEVKDFDEDFVTE